MKKVLYILGSLADADVDWLVAAGKPTLIPAGEKLIQEGKLLTQLPQKHEKFSVWKK